VSSRIQIERDGAAGSQLDRAVKSYQDLMAWQRSMALAEACYRTTAQFPRDELSGMTVQIRQAAASIPVNNAEGVGREMTGSIVQSLRISQGSLKELEAHLLPSERAGLARPEQIESFGTICDETGRMSRALIRSLHSKQST
jgi:four helix bundle protein